MAQSWLSELMNTTVIKRDNTKEPYDESKVWKVLVSAGLSLDRAKLLALEISEWIKKNADESVSSLVLRDKVLELLEKTDSDVADLYRWYQKTKER